ncbi:MAG: HIT family protein [Lachnospiraceae bacterium]|jgi:Diadenosine tetraphosphate (Ap4A) hydrolase and other HIT family hydrolases|nr:HIT family protein [Lachnospiraceae bacterium]MCI8825037.1 HIT family protein [Lachnospiraceae bacterium]MCI9369702.1 HIT family protein [Lachnospiraceae bacterium]
MKDENCIFCKIASGDIPSYTLYEDNLFKVFLDLSPTSFGHALLIPKEHYANLFELEDEIASKIFVLAKKVASAMKTSLQCDGFNLLQNNGEIAGQTMFHFHIHLIPRYKDDNTKITFDHKSLKEEDAKRILDTIKKCL